MFFVLFGIVASTISSFSEERIAFVAPAEQRLVLALSTVHEPDEFRSKQNLEDLDVETSTWLFSVMRKPKQIPEQEALLLNKRLAEIKPPTPIDKSEPLMGPERTFIAFTSSGKAVAIIHLGYTDKITISECRSTGVIFEMADDSPIPMNMTGVISTNGDLFQRSSRKEFEFVDAKVVEFLRGISQPTKDARNPFRRWLLELETRQVDQENPKPAEQGGDAKTDPPS